MSTPSIVDPLPDGVDCRQDFAFDRYRGSADALIAAGLIEQHQLPPQPGRNPGRATFFPDGAPVPPGHGGVPREEGYKVIKEAGEGRYAVDIYVSKEEHRRRWINRPADIYETPDHWSGDGLKEQLLQAGVPRSWFGGLPRPGKKSGRRRRTVGDWEIEVTQAITGRFSIYARRKKEEEPEQAPVLAAPVRNDERRPGLRLVWSAP